MRCDFAPCTKSRPLLFWYIADMQIFHQKQYGRDGWYVKLSSAICAWNSRLFVASFLLLILCWTFHGIFLAAGSFTVEKEKEGKTMHAGRENHPPRYSRKRSHALWVPGTIKFLQHRRKKTMSEINEDLQGCRLDLKSSLMLWWW
jgi:hypothetical protein